MFSQAANQKNGKRRETRSNRHHNIFRYGRQFSQLVSPSARSPHTNWWEASPSATPCRTLFYMQELAFGFSPHWEFISMAPSPWWVNQQFMHIFFISYHLIITVYSYEGSLLFYSTFFFLIGSCSVQLIDSDGVFNHSVIKYFMRATNMDKCGMDYSVVSMLGKKESGMHRVLRSFSSFCIIFFSSSSYVFFFFFSFFLSLTFFS